MIWYFSLPDGFQILLSMIILIHQREDIWTLNICIMLVLWQKGLIRYHFQYNISRTNAIYAENADC